MTKQLKKSKTIVTIKAKQVLIYTLQYNFSIPNLLQRFLALFIYAFLAFITFYFFYYATVECPLLNPPVCNIENLSELSETFICGRVLVLKSSITLFGGTQY